MVSKCWSRDGGMVGPSYDNPTVHPLAVWMLHYKFASWMFEEGPNRVKLKFKASCNICICRINLGPLLISFLASGFQTLMVSVGGLIEEWSLHDPTIPNLWLQYLRTCTIKRDIKWATFLDARCTLNHPTCSSPLSKGCFFLAPGMFYFFSSKIWVSACIFEDMAWSLGSRK